ncbi:MAG TPA: lytic transglycosylase domain-containing protein [Acidobacteriota bacterium]|nr:lytic transglycosylase domain-containing protein [Acidobacteriota bacterium]HRV07820.1 lytic transglycosylase domain-containing protein [Acidobacteriota bacterium]
MRLCGSSPQGRRRYHDNQPMSRGALTLLTGAFLIVLSVSLSAEGVYSYVDEAGVRVLTNLGHGRRPAPGSSSRMREASADETYDALIQEAAQEYGVDEGLIRAVIQVESNFNPRAVSRKNCKGLMQLHPETATRFGVRDVFDPVENINGGVRYLRHLLDRFGDRLDWVLAAYNAGENAVLQYGGVPPYAETTGYVEKVRALLPERFDRSVPRRQKIVRFLDEDGSVVLTNVPTQPVESLRREVAVRTDPPTSPPGSNARETTHAAN